jgi:hypothetical protein
MNTTLKNVLIVIAGLTTLGAVAAYKEAELQNEVHGKKAPVEVREYWKAQTHTDQFGKMFETRTLKGAHTTLTVYDKGLDGRLVFQQKGFIDCGNTTDVKIKIDDKPAKTFYLDTLPGCDIAITKNKAFKDEVLNAKTLVIQMNPNGAYAGRTETIKAF